jgi:O-antigen ligase
LLTLSLPLPALYSTDRLRLSLAPIATAAVLLAWLMARAADRRTARLGALPRRAALGLLGAVAFAGLFAEHKLIALRELVRFSLLLGLLAVATDVLSAGPRKIRSAALTLAVGVGACGWVAVLEAIGIVPGRFPLPGTTFNRAAVGFGWPNELAMFMALALPFSVCAVETAQSTWARMASIAGLGATVAGLAATFSRGSWLAVLGATLILLVGGERRFVLRVWGVALIAAAAMDPSSGGALRYRAEGTATDWVVTQRLALTATGLRMFREHPFLGVGPGAFGDNLDRFGPQVVGLWDYTGSAQNGYVHMAAETGAPGLIALVVLFGAVLLRLVRGARRGRRDPQVRPEEASLRRAVLWSFAIACSVSLVEWPFAEGIGQLIMLVAAMGFALERLRTARAIAPAGDKGAR